MRKPSVSLGALLGVISSLPLLALFYMGERLADLPFFPFDLFDWMARELPGGMVTFGIDAMVETIRFLNGGEVSDVAKSVEQGMALLMIVVGTAVAGGLIALTLRRTEAGGSQAGAVFGFIGLALALVVESTLGFGGNGLQSVLWLALLFPGWGAVLGRLVDATAIAAPAADGEDEHVLDAGRRDLLLKATGSSLALAVGAWGIGRLLESGEAASGAGRPLAEITTATPPSATAAPTVTGPAPSITATPAPNLEERLEPAPGTRAELTSNEDFYRIDINTRSPVIDGEEWALEVDGLFEQPRNLTLDDLMAFPAVTQAITLSCISNRIGGDLIGTSYWTGVRLRDVLAELRLQPEAGALFIEAEDGFYETVIAEDMMDDRTLLVYGMNDETLPVEHGYPLRIYIPNRYGMKQPKWIVRMEAVEAWRPGYWVERGWSREARPHIISVIDTIATEAVSEDGLVPIGGIAWAGDRGIQKVELQVDDGEWVETQLRKPPLSTLTWVQWRYDWPATEGRHTLTVRATDGTGELQTAERTGVRPDGATGYHSESARI